MLIPSNVRCTFRCIHVHAILHSQLVQRHLAVFSNFEYMNAGEVVATSHRVSAAALTVFSDCMALGNDHISSLGALDGCLSLEGMGCMLNVPLDQGTFIVFCL